MKLRRKIGFPKEIKVTEGTISNLSLNKFNEGSLW